jgi:hypothetical protein
MAYFGRLSGVAVLKDDTRCGRLRVEATELGVYTYAALLGRDAAARQALADTLLRDHAKNFAAV